MEGFVLKPREIQKLVKEGEGMRMTEMSASHPQLPLGLEPKCWAMPAFSDQEQSSGWDGPPGPQLWFFKAS